jgi:fructose/tagatose bisphosphate aldolase
MALTKFNDLMREAEKGQYAVGYFESWNLESLQAVADAAEAMHSPVLLGFSGIYLHHPDRLTRESLSVYAAMGNEMCRQMSVPACLLFNESPHFERVIEAIDLKFGVVMYSDDNDQIRERVRRIVSHGHHHGVAVEAEMTALPGVSGGLTTLPRYMQYTDPGMARAFVNDTGIDALAVNIGQAHLHGLEEVPLNLGRLAELKETIEVPMVLHGATSVRRADLQAAIHLGIRKINVGSILKRTYFEALRAATAEISQNYNPYDVVGSGLKDDALTKARIALPHVVQELIKLFGSEDKA